MKPCSVLNSTWKARTNLFKKIDCTALLVHMLVHSKMSWNVRKFIYSSGSKCHLLCKYYLSSFFLGYEVFLGSITFEYIMRMIKYLVLQTIYFGSIVVL